MLPLLFWVKYQRDNDPVIRRKIGRHYMHFRAPMIAMTCALMLAAAPAMGAGLKAHEDCDADDPDRNIAGCTRIIEDDAEGDTMHAVAYVARGLAWQAKGNLDRALADYTDAIRLNPRDALAYNNRGLLWREKGDADRAIADLTDAIRIDPLPHSDLLGNGHVNIYANRGLAWETKGDLDRAIADFDQAIRLDPKDADAYDRRSQVFIAKHDADHAIADLDEAIRLDPSRAYNHYVRGVVRYDRYMGFMGGGWIEKEDLKQAISDFTEAIRLDAKNASSHYARALAWNTEGDRERAVADLTEAARLAPDNPQFAAALKQLKP
jgi:tetratricopeptide (TPR) repeat protein